MDFAAIDRKSGLRRKEQLKTRAKILGFPYVSQFIYDWYCIQGKRPKEIAWELRVSYQSIYRWLTLWGFAPMGKNFITEYIQASSFRGELVYVPLNLQTVRELWSAVMEQTMRDIRKGNKAAPGALSWVENTVDEDCPSFIWVAELLGFDPAAVRKAVLNELS